MKVYRDLIAKDKDRNKLTATKELALIALLCNPNSYLFSYPEARRMARGIKDMHLPEGWKPHKLWEAAFQQYREDSVTPSIKVLIEAKEALLLAADTLKLIRGRVQMLVDEGGEIKELVESLQELFKLTKELPDMLSRIQKLEEAVRKEQSSEKVYGSGVVGEYEE